MGGATTASRTDVKVSIIAGPATGLQHEIPADRPLVVGRGEGADLIVDDQQMSRRHFALIRRATACELRDLDSTNGTFVNGTRIRSIFLTPHDRIVAGESDFSVGESSEHDTESVPRKSEAVLDHDEDVMRLVNRTDLPVATMLWQDASGAARLTVVIKATFTLRSSPKPSAVQWPIATADRHYRDDPLASVKYESDMVPIKPLGDVVLVGNAHAPGGQPVTRLEARLEVASVTSAISVTGDRLWVPSSIKGGEPTISSPQPFTVMPIVYERAYGGHDVPASMYFKFNPIGQGFIGACDSASIHGKRLPNLEDPRNRITSWSSRPKPAGFGFFGRGWMPRLAYAGTYDEHHYRTRASDLPRDFSWRFFNGAHPDLQLPQYLCGNEPVALQNLSPDAAVRFKVPRVAPAVRVCLRGSGSAPAVNDPVTNLDTLVLVPDKGIFYVVYRAVCPLPSLDAHNVRQILVTCSEPGTLN